MIKNTVALAATIVLTLASVLLVLALAVGPVLNSSPARRLALKALDSITGFSWQIRRIRFAYPFHLTAEGLSLQGPVDSGKDPIRVCAESATIRSGLKALVHAQVDEIRVDGVDLDVGLASRGAQGGAASLEGRHFEIPEWIWRIKRASIRISTARAHSTGETLLCVEDLYAAWTHLPGTSSGRFEFSLNSRPGSPQPPDLVLVVTPESITALSGPAVLPALDLAPLAGFEGLDAAVTGTLSGAVFPVPGPRGAEALYLDLFVEDLTLEGRETDAGLSGGSLHLGGVVLLPGHGAGLAVFMKDVTGSIEDLTVAGERRGPVLRNLDLSGSLGFDTLSDNADWTLDVRDRQVVLSAHISGTLEGVLSGTRRTTASVLARCGNMGALEEALSSLLSLPARTTLQGEWSANAALAGSFESMNIKGSANTSGFEIDWGRNLSLPVRLDASFSGSLRRGGVEAFQVDTNRFEIDELAAPRASASYGPNGLTGTVRIDSMDAKHLAELLGPFLPSGLSGYEWGGTLSLSGNASMGSQKGSSIRANVSAGLRGGKFASSDYQRMGEGIDFDVHGTLRLPEAHTYADLVLGASLPKGEIVLGDIYGSLAKSQPRLQLDLRHDLESGALQIRSAGMVLDGVGAAGLEGRFSRGPRGVQGSAKIEIGPVEVGGLLNRILRDTAAGRYPGIQGMTGSGTFSVATTLDVEDSSYRARGKATIEGVSLEDPSQKVSVKTIDMNLPFAVATAPARISSRRAEEHPVEPGVLTIEGIDFRGLEIPGMHARMLVADNALTILSPMHIPFAGGSVNVAELKVQGLGYGSRKGGAILEIDGLDLSAIAKAGGWGDVEGHLNARFNDLAYEDGSWKMAGRLGVQIRDGELRVEEIELEAPPSGSPLGSCAVQAKNIPLEALTRQRVQPPLEGTLNGDLPEVRLSQGHLETKGSFTLSVFGGTVSLSHLSAGGLFGPNPFAQLDIDMKEIHLAALTSPLKFGRISGVLQGWVHGLRIRPGFPYATAFDADLETVKTRGVPRKIDATAVQTLSRIGGSRQLAAILSKGLYRYFDEYYYKQMGLRATLKDGWLELHGIPKDKKEYLVTRAFRIPTLSMPIMVMTPNHKIRFNSWLENLMRVGHGKQPP